MEVNLQEINTKVDELGTLTRQFMSVNDTIRKEMLEGNKARAAELEVQLKRINDRLDTIETKASRPNANVEDVLAKVKEIESKQVDQYRRWVKKGEMPLLTPEEMKTISLSTDSDAAGGILVPRNVSNIIRELLVLLSPFRKYAAGETLTQGDTWEEPVENATFSTSTNSERGTPAQTNAGTFVMKKIPTHYAYAMPAATQKMLDDSGTSVEAWISKKLGQQFAKQEGAWFVTGTGVEQPEGVLSNGDINVRTGGQSATIDINDMLDLESDLPSFYAQSASFFVKRSVQFVLRKLVDGTGRYLWQPALTVGTPPNFDGYPVVETPDMNDVGSSNKVVIFGDLGQGYKIVDRQGIVQTRDNLTAKPFVLFYTTRRVGGGVILPEAIKILKCGA